MDAVRETGRVIMRTKCAPLVILLSLLPTFGCVYVANIKEAVTRPRVVHPQEVSKIIGAIPSYTEFSYSGLCFFNKKLYASSNIGLLEFDGGSLSQLYKWYDRDDVISGPWLDDADKSVWVMHDGMDKLIRYDGNTWSETELPQPKEGYTRGDMLEGFRGAGTPEGFWLEGGGHAWRWNNRNSGWEPVPIPQDYPLVRFIPLPDIKLMITRHTPFPSMVSEDEDFQSDTVQFFDKKWERVTNKTGENFFVEQVVLVNDVAYIRTTKGHILRITPAEITKLDAPGECEAMTVTTSGSLLASFRNSGIYEYKGGWNKKYSSPYPPAEGEHWAYLAESDGQVAFAVSPKPQLHEDRVKYINRATLWLSDGDELKAVKVGER
jgi:hypothetical protein